MNVLSWATFALITYAWLWTDKLDRVPWWGPVGALVLNSLPGGQLGDLLKVVGLALVDKIPTKGAGK